MMWNRRIEHWAIRSSARSFARTAHSFASLRLFARSLARSLTRFRAHGKVVYVFEMNASFSYKFGPLCSGRIFDSLKKLKTIRTIDAFADALARVLEVVPFLDLVLVLVPVPYGANKSHTRFSRYLNCSFSMILNRAWQTDIATYKDARTLL